MRGIKFRAWLTAEKKHIPVPRISFGDDGAALTVIVDTKTPEGFDRGYVAGENAILEQWTGMKDCTGREIYEGDIITAAVETYPWYDGGKPNYVGVVEWVFGGWQYVMRLANTSKRGISDGMNNGLDDDGEGGKHFRVIGHIHEERFRGDDAS